MTLIPEVRLSEIEAHADEGGTFQAAVVQELIGHIRANAVQPVRECEIDEQAMQQAWALFLVQGKPFTYRDVRQLFQDYESSKKPPASVDHRKIGCLIHDSWDDSKKKHENVIAIYDAIKPYLTSMRESGTQWIPANLNTAPKDGTPILGFWRFTKSNFNMTAVAFYDGDWRDLDGHNLYGFDYWLPLPKTPSTHIEDGASK